MYFRLFCYFNVFPDVSHSSRCALYARGQHMEARPMPRPDDHRYSLLLWLVNRNRVLFPFIVNLEKNTWVYSDLVYPHFPSLLIWVLTEITPGRSTKTIRCIPGPFTDMEITSVDTVRPPRTLLRMRISTSLYINDNIDRLTIYYSVTVMCYKCHHNIYLQAIHLL